MKQIELFIECKINGNNIYFSSNLPFTKQEREKFESNLDAKPKDITMKLTDESVYFLRTIDFKSAEQASERADWELVNFNDSLTGFIEAIIEDTEITVDTYF